MAGGRGPPGVRLRPRTGEPVVRVGPGRGLLGIESGRTDPVGQLGEVMTAALAHGSERDRVPGQAQRDLVRLPGAVTAAHGGDGQH
jgi:hypothetical protein